MIYFLFIKKYVLQKHGFLSLVTNKVGLSWCPSRKMRTKFSKKVLINKKTNYFI